ncbi:uncharacterized protein LOC141524069 [Cotesia typhae]|uniref:uncharacterized protein LOC141524069 n=1 Tax=Cotesia typhae TaxID=2053667 RepID=UPI003D68F06D
MFAYVKYLPPDNNCAVVATSQIRKFKLDKFDKFKHYKIISGDVTKKALILAIKDSKEELDSIVSSGKRHPIPPGYLQKSCTEESDIESTLQKVITTDANKVKSVLEKNCCEATTIAGCSDINGLFKIKS